MCEVALKNNIMAKSGQEMAVISRKGVRTTFDNTVETLLDAIEAEARSGAFEYKCDLPESVVKQLPATIRKTFSRLRLRGYSIIRTKNAVKQKFTIRVYWGQKDDPNKGEVPHKKASQKWMDEYGAIRII